MKFHFFSANQEKYIKNNISKQKLCLYIIFNLFSKINYIRSIFSNLIIFLLAITNLRFFKPSLEKLYFLLQIYLKTKKV